MKGIKLMIKQKIATLINGWDDSLILSYLQGHMGYAIVDNEQRPKSALIVNGDFCFLVGEANAELVKKITSLIIVPQNKAWEEIIESTLKNKVKKILRYAIKKQGTNFDIKKLEEFAKLENNTKLEKSNLVNNEYSIKLIDEDIYQKAMSEKWSVDFCSQFEDFEDFRKRGLGFAIMHGKEIVCGASSYIIYDSGLEIEIGTKKEYREKGLATACAAKLILECLDRDIYPSWDAADLRSLALAEKLGYRLDKAYTCYEMVV